MDACGCGSGVETLTSKGTLHPLCNKFPWKCFAPILGLEYLLRAPTTDLIWGSLGLPHKGITVWPLFGQLQLWVCQDKIEAGCLLRVGWGGNQSLAEAELTGRDCACLLASVRVLETGDMLGKKVKGKGEVRPGRRTPQGMGGSGRASARPDLCASGGEGVVDNRPSMQWVRFVVFR